MSASAALAVVCALWVRTVACGELHSSLLMRTVYVHQECIADVLASRLFKFIHAIEGHHQTPQHRVTVGPSFTTNLSAFVDGSSSSLGREVRFSETLLFSRDWPEHGEERHRVSASIDEPQIAIN